MPPWGSLLMSEPHGGLKFIDILSICDKIILAVKAVVEFGKRLNSFTRKSQDDKPGSQGIRG